MTTVEFVDRVTWKCPFCDGQATAGYAGSEKEPAVIHTLPMCAAFSDLAADDYMAACRTKMVAQN